MNKNIQAAQDAVSMAETDLTEAKANLSKVIVQEYPFGTMVFFDSGRGESSAPVIAAAGEFLYLDTARGKKINFADIRLVPAETANA